MYQCSLVPRPSDWEEGERRPGIHCMCMRYVFHVFYRKSVRKCIQTVSVRNRIFQNLNNGACARSGYQAFFPPPPQSEGLGMRLISVVQSSIAKTVQLKYAQCDFVILPHHGSHEFHKVPLGYSCLNRERMELILCAQEHGGGGGEL